MALTFRVPCQSVPNSSSPRLSVLIRKELFSSWGILFGESTSPCHVCYLLTESLRLDIIRAFSSPERLCFTQELRLKLLSLCNLRFEAVNGCPRDIVLIIAAILECAKAYSSGKLEYTEFYNTIRESIRKLYLWDGSRCFFPDESTIWVSVSNAFRHACILRAWRLLDPSEPPSEPRIRDSVLEILDSVANIPSTSPLIELMVLPLFMAGADSLSAHSRHYVILRLEQIKGRSEMGNAAPLTLLEKVWHARSEQAQHDTSNIPWMSFVSILLNFLPALSRIKLLITKGFKFRFVTPR